MPGTPIAKSAIAALGRLLDGAASAAYAIDGQRRIVYCNQACCQWLGIGPEALIGQTCNYTSAGENDLASRLCPPPEVLQGKQPSTEHFVVSPRARRRARFLPVQDAAGEVCGVIAIVDRADLAGDERDSISPRADSAAIHQWLSRFRRQHRGRVPDALLGQSPAMLTARARFNLALESQANVLIVGPPGSGAHQVARAIPLAGGPDRAVSQVPCAELGEQLLAATVDWFTSGAARQRQADLILDDVDRLKPELQTTLCDLLASGRLAARLLSTASCDLDELVRQGGFRPDLASRLSALVIQIAPLNDRLADIPLLAQALVEKQNAAGGKQLSGFSPQALDRLALYSWPRNFVEFAETVQSAHEHAEETLIAPRDLPDFFQHVAGVWAHPAAPEEQIVLDQVLSQIELELIEQALARAKGNKTRAAELLGMNRPRFYRRLIQLGLIAASDEEAGEAE